MVKGERILFYDRSLSDVLANLDVQVQKEIDGLGKEVLLTESVEVLCDRLEQKYRVDVKAADLRSEDSRRGDVAPVPLAAEG